MSNKKIDNQKKSERPSQSDKIEQLKGNAAIFVRMEDLREYVSEEVQPQLDAAIDEYEGTIYLGELLFNKKTDIADINPLQKLMKSVFGMGIGSISYFNHREALDRLKINAAPVGSARHNLVRDYLIDLFGSDEIKNKLVASEDACIEKKHLSLTFNLNSSLTEEEINNINTKANTLVNTIDRASKEVLARSFLRSFESSIKTMEATEKLNSSEQAVLACDKGLLAVKIPLSDILKAAIEGDFIDIKEITGSIGKEVRLALHQDIAMKHALT